MHFGLNDIDPAIAESLRSKVRELWGMGWGDHDQPHTEERDRMLQVRDILQRVGKPGLSSTARNWIGAVTIGVIVGALGVLIKAPLFILGAPAVPLGYLLCWQLSKTVRIDEMGRTLTAEEIEALDSVLRVGDIEHSYLGALSLLAGVGGEMDRETVRSVLGDLNSLVQQWRQLEQYRQNLVIAVGSASAAELDTKRADLARRLELMRDPAARTAAEHSLQLIDERIAGAEKLHPNLERVEAQIGAISEAFQATRSTLARMRIAPAPTAAPDLEEIAHNINQVAQQARAVEQAVQEVAAIRV